jgi:hypothetical protein
MVAIAGKSADATALLGMTKNDPVSLQGVQAQRQSQPAAAPLAYGVLQANNALAGRCISLIHRYGTT